MRSVTCSRNRAWRVSRPERHFAFQSDARKGQSGAVGSCYDAVEREARPAEELRDHDFEPIMRMKAKATKTKSTTKKKKMKTMKKKKARKSALGYHAARARCCRCCCRLPLTSFLFRADAPMQLMMQVMR